MQRVSRAVNLYLFKATMAYMLCILLTSSAAISVNAAAMLRQSTSSCSTASMIDGPPSRND
jgi:hypothetical protein